MKQVEEGSERFCLKSSLAIPPLLPQPGSGVRKKDGESITNKQIKKFWRQKQIIEEEHIFAAIKAAARVRARSLSEDDYKCFEESLDLEKLEIISSNNSLTGKEVHVGIKDWWTKSRYAYLNQPTAHEGSADCMGRKRRSSYVPNCFPLKPTIPLYPTSLDVF
ncbi:PREDICTED: uncharacterized protein LOC104804280 isoform X2 [Tarenaya hassleriana]|uniref:uncharacterized protein LOC104804280 isoform X2 n=1 Tax=Tarenaya hassleriana TaxID=28532 RepID=UPI00053C457E|nr:PREDICTED: uncharacterized protein LOC104804280 isoform X2 [Tarenaya hassleriana]